LGGRLAAAAEDERAEWAETGGSPPAKLVRRVRLCARGLLPEALTCLLLTSAPASSLAGKLGRPPGGDGGGGGGGGGGCERSQNRSAAAS